MKRQIVNHMIQKLDLKDTAVARMVLEVQTAAYSIEARIINFDGIPPLYDTVDTLACCEEIFYGFFIENKLAGIISVKYVDKLIDIHRLAVHPDFFRRQIAERLVSFIEKTETKARKVIVSTGKENFPAVNLYLKKGYRKSKDVEIAEGIYITRFEKVLNNN